MRALIWVAAVGILAAAAYYILAANGEIRPLIWIAAVIMLAAAAYHILATMDEVGPLVRMGAIIMLVASAYYILATIGVLMAAAMGFGGVESIIWIVSVGILVVAGLLAGALSLRANGARRRGKHGLPQ